MASGSSSPAWTINFERPDTTTTTTSSDSGRCEGRATSTAATSSELQGREVQPANHNRHPLHPKVQALVDVALRLAERFGIPVVILAFVLWWAKTDIVQPLLNAHFSFIERIVEGQEEHRKQVEDLGRKLDELIEITQTKK